MINSDIRISDLQLVLDKRYGQNSWLDWEPETILSDLGASDFLLAEKIYVLKGLNKALNSIISLPEFLFWTTSVCNNEFAEFEILKLPTSLELAWALEEVKKIGYITGQAFTPSPELIDVVSFILRHEGYSKPVETFSFIPETKLVAGQTESDTSLKALAIRKYIDHMGSNHNEKVK